MVALMMAGSRGGVILPVHPTEFSDDVRTVTSGGAVVEADDPWRGQAVARDGLHQAAGQGKGTSRGDAGNHPRQTQVADHEDVERVAFSEQGAQRRRQRQRGGAAGVKRDACQHQQKPQQQQVGEQVALVDDHAQGRALAQWQREVVLVLAHRVRSIDGGRHGVARGRCRE